MFLTQKHLNRFVSAVLVVVFTFSFICPPDIARAQILPVLPGEMLSVTSGFVPVLIKGMTPDPVNPLGFDFIIDSGHTGMEGEALKAEAQKLVKYFLVALTVPEEDLWVNLSPYEKDRMIPADFGSTEMGRDLLAQDYILKQLTASLMYPEQELGQEFWNDIYSKVEERTGVAEVPLNSFHKVWIVPDEAVVYEHKGTVYVVKSHLKVMLEEDYLALQKTLGESSSSSVGSASGMEGQGAAFTQALKDVLIPEIEREVNEGKHFANLRQVYNSMILAAWYKANLRQTILSQVYVDQAKVKGIDLKDPAVNQKIYDQYVEAFKKGAYDYIKEEVDETSGEMIPRRYFSGGTSAVGLFKAFAGEQAPGVKVEVVKDAADGRPATNAAVLREGLKEQGTTYKVPVQLLENVDETVANTPAVNSAIITKISVPVLTDPATGKEQPIVFGTSGNRGKITSGFHQINVPRDAYAAAKYTLKAEPGKAMLVGFDPREGNNTSAKLIASINAAQGVRTIIINEPTPTPVLAVIAQSDEMIGGVVNLTASHNPYEDDGFKYSPSHGGAAPKAVTTELEKTANSVEEIPVMDYEAAKKRGLIVEMSAEDAVRIYVHEYLVPGLKKIGAWADIVAYIKANPDFHVYEDPMQGTMVKYARALLQELAKDAGRPFFTMIHENNMDAKFTEVDGQPRPEAPGSHKTIRDLVSGFQGKAFGLMQDGDADRFGNIDFDSAFIGANDMMALIAYFLAKDIGLKGQIGKTVATSNMVNAIAAFLNAGEVDEEAVGFKWFVEKIVSQGRQYLIAGEESAHVGVGPFMKSWDDGLVVGLMGLWIVTRTGMSLQEYKEKVLEALDMRFQISTLTLRGKNDSVKNETNRKIAQAKEELAVGTAMNDLSIVKEMNQRLADAGINDRVVDVITKDGVKLVLNTGWILLRPSGTEPAVKAYAEAFGKFSDSQQVMQEKYDQLKKIVLLLTGVTREQLEDKAKVELGEQWVNVLPSEAPASNAAVLSQEAGALKDFVNANLSGKVVVESVDVSRWSTNDFDNEVAAAERAFRETARVQVRSYLDGVELNTPSWSPVGEWTITLSENEKTELAMRISDAIDFRGESLESGTKYVIRSAFSEQGIESAIADIFRDAVVRLRLSQILLRTGWWKSSPLLTGEEKAAIADVEERNMLAGPGIDETEEETARRIEKDQSLYDAWMAASRKRSEAIDLKTEEIIGWLRSDRANFKNDDVAVLDQDGEVLDRIDRGIAEKLILAFRDLSESEKGAAATNAAVLDLSARDLTDWMVSNFDQKVVIRSRNPEEWTIHPDRFGERRRQAEQQYREALHQQVEVRIETSEVLGSLPVALKGKLAEGLLETVSFSEQQVDGGTMVVRSLISPQRVVATVRTVFENAATQTNAAVLPGANKVGGIDLNTAALNLQIKRDGEGIPLPLPQQPLNDMTIDGFYPVIINILPVQGIPAFLGMDANETDAGETRQSAGAMDPAQKLDPFKS